MALLMMILPGCGAVDRVVNLSTSYDTHFEQNEFEIKDKTLTSRWQTKAAQAAVISKDKTNKKDYDNAEEVLLVNNETN